MKYKRYTQKPMRRIQFIIICAMAALGAFRAAAETREAVRFGDFEQWVTRDIDESAIIGGKTRQVYAIGPTAHITGSTPYEPRGGSPWATSNVLAKVAGVTKTSNAVFPDTRPGGGRCAKLTTIVETCKVIGLINIKVLVAGSMFLGRMFEPIKSTSDPYSKLEMGVPFTKKPAQLAFDYRVLIPEGDTRLYSSGFSRQRTLPGHDNAEVMVLLQRRWEDEDGNLHAKRVGTGREVFSRSSDGWVDDHRVDITYGQAGAPMGLIPEDRSYCARNSRGEVVPVREEGWDESGTVPTHILVMFSAASGTPYTGTVGLTLWVDNVALIYK